MRRPTPSAPAAPGHWAAGSEPAGVVLAPAELGKHSFIFPAIHLLYCYHKCMKHSALRAAWIYSSLGSNESEHRFNEVFFHYCSKVWTTFFHGDTSGGNTKRWEQDNSLWSLTQGKMSQVRILTTKNSTHQIHKKKFCKQKQVSTLPTPIWWEGVTIHQVAVHTSWIWHKANSHLSSPRVVCLRELAAYCSIVKLVTPFSAVLGRKYD